MSWDWRADLEANADRKNLMGAITSFFMVPSFNIVCWIRLMLTLQKKDTRLSRFLSRIIANKLVCKYGVHVSVMVKSIGKGFRLPHPTGIVIGDGAVIGDNVLILQNVTLGKKKLKEAGTPTIGDGASVLAGAAILGNVKIGKNAAVGANSVVLKDVPENSIAVGIPAHILTSKS